MTVEHKRVPIKRPCVIKLISARTRVDGQARFYIWASKICETTRDLQPNKYMLLKSSAKGFLYEWLKRMKAIFLFFLLTQLLNPPYWQVITLIYARRAFYADWARKRRTAYVPHFSQGPISLIHCQKLYAPTKKKKKKGVSSPIELIAI